MGSHRVRHDWSDLACMHTLEKTMAANSSVLAWSIPGTEEHHGLLSVGLHRVGHDWSDLACMHALEKEMATHSSVLAWRIPETGEPGGLLSMRSHRVRHDWSDLAAAAAAAAGYPQHTLLPYLPISSVFVHSEIWHLAELLWMSKCLTQESRTVDLLNSSSPCHLGLCLHPGHLELLSVEFRYENV